MQYCYMQPDLEFILEIINGNGIFYEWQELGSQVWDEGRLIEFEVLNEAAIDEAIAPVPQLRVSPSTPFSKVLTFISFLFMI